MKKPIPGAVHEPRSRGAGAGQAKVKERIDVALVARGLCDSREKAARLLLAGAVTVDGKRVDKPGVLVAPGADLRVTARPKFVSRGGDKLVHALDVFAVSSKGARLHRRGRLHRRLHALPARGGRLSRLRRGRGAGPARRLAHGRTGVSW